MVLFAIRTITEAGLDNNVCEEIHFVKDHDDKVM